MDINNKYFVMWDSYNRVLRKYGVYDVQIEYRFKAEKGVPSLVEVPITKKKHATSKVLMENEDMAELVKVVCKKRGLPFEKIEAEAEDHYSSRFSRSKKKKSRANNIEQDSEVKVMKKYAVNAKNKLDDVGINDYVDIIEAHDPAEAAMLASLDAFDCVCIRQVTDSEAEEYCFKGYFNFVVVQYLEGATTLDDFVDYYYDVDEGIDRKEKIITQTFVVLSK